MTQSPLPPSQYPPSPYDMYGRPPFDPGAPARRASVMMWVLGTIAVLFGLCCAAFMVPFIDQLKAGTLPNSGPDVDRARDQIRQLEAQFGMSASNMLLTGGIVTIVAGGIMGTLAFFVRRGGRGAVITAIVLDSLMLLYLAFNLLASMALGGAANLAGSLCVMIVPIVLLGLLLHWLIQAARNAPLLAAGRQHGGGFPVSQGPPPGYYPPPPPPGHYPPPPGAAGPTGQQQPPPMAQPPASHPVMGQPGQGATPAGFGPAPFGIPPPPGETPPGKYGYATKPPSDNSTGGGGAGGSAPPSSDAK